MEKDPTEVTLEYNALCGVYGYTVSFVIYKFFQKFCTHQKGLVLVKLFKFKVSPSDAEERGRGMLIMVVLYSGLTLGLAMGYVYG